MTKVTEFTKKVKGQVTNTVLNKATWIVHLGPEDRATSWQRVQAFRDLGHEVYQLYYSRLDEKPSLLTRTYRSLRRRAGWPVEQCDENAALLGAAKRYSPDVVFVEKGLTIWPSTLRRLHAICPCAVLVSYSLDDVMNPGNRSRYYMRGLPLYDVHFTTKEFNVPELLAYGARRVELTGNAYSPHVHRPIHVSSEDRAIYGADVSFVGGYEKARAASLNYMAEHGIPVRVWGNNWHRFKNPHPNLKLEKRPAYGEEYAKVACSSKILLGFLRKSNRDTQTTRSVEIPAFGAFMLAERSADHQALFEEGIEAEYFGSDEELVEKTKYYLLHDEERDRIAKAGLERCLNSGYSYNHRMQELIEICNEILDSKRRSVLK